ncbi:hypothetical protein NUSPORA_00490 [Nucleospora cyclopteri]
MSVVVNNAPIITRGIKKSSTAVCECKKTGDFEVRVNHVPLNVHTDSLLVAKFEEVISLIKEETLKGLDFDIKYERTGKAGGKVGRIYAARQAFCRAVLAHLGTTCDEYKKQEVQQSLMQFDRFSVITDTRTKEPKKYGGPGARARYQKSYR